MKCQGCDGEVSVTKWPGDIRGVCKECHGAYLANKRVALAVEWCKCKECKPETTIYYFSDSGRHGWLHTVCGQITQTG